MTLNLITDRTSEDVKYANSFKGKAWNELTTQQKADYMLGLKGTYNYTDLNRVENAVQYLSDVLNAYGYRNVVNTVNTWNIQSVPTVSQIQRYINNIAELKNKYYSSIKGDLPNTNNWLNYEHANYIEKLLENIEQLIIGMENNFVHSGVANSGQNRLWQQRFRRLKVFGSQPYKVSQYDENDTWETISDSSSDAFSRTNKLNLPQFTSHNKVGASLNELNSMFETISGLVGDISE